MCVTMHRLYVPSLCLHNPFYTVCFFRASALLATVLLQKLQKDILSLRKKKDKINPEGALFALRNQKCKVYADEIVPQEAVKSINDLCKLFQIVCPASIPRNL